MDDELIVRAAIRDELTGPLREIRDELQGTARDAASAGAKANIGARGFDRMASGAGRFVKAGIGTAARLAATGIAVLSAAAVAGSAKVLQLASDAAETASAFGTVFKGVSGDVAGYVERMNKQFGITTAELQRAATTFGVFGKAAGVSRRDLGGFTKDLVTAGLDLSSFYNADPTEVFTALRSGLAGEAEPLRQFGIFLSDATLKAEAATMGLKGELTESQKVMLRQRIIMKSLGDAEGDLARTQDGLANKTKAIKGRFVEMGTAIGTQLLPYAERAANALDDKLAGALERLPDQLDAAEAKIVGLVDTGRRFYKTFQAKGLDGVVGKIDRMADAGGKLKDAFAKGRAVYEDVATIVTDSLAPAFEDVATVLPGVLSPLTLVDDVLDFMADHTEGTRVALTGLVVVLTAAKVASLLMAAAQGTSLALLMLQTPGTAAYAIAAGAASLATGAWAVGATLLAGAMTILTSPITLVIAGLALLVGGLILAYKKSETFRNIVHGAMDVARTAIGWVVDAIKRAVEWVSDLVGKITGAKHSMGELASAAESMAARIRSAMGSVVDAAGMVGDAIRASYSAANTAPSFATPSEGGDTATSRARGGSIGNTLATHARVSAATGTRPTITNAFVGGGGKGRGSGDHQAGRALDLTGRNLDRYASHMRAIGGYAAFHGTGSSRHLHAVPPMGDTATSMARAVRSRRSATAGGITLEAGAVVVQVNNPSDNVDVAEAVAQGIRDYVRDREERG